MYGIVLLEEPGTDGLTKSEVMDLFDMLDDAEAYPIELWNYSQDCCAMGFISVSAAEKIDYDYEESGLHDFIAEILGDMANESDDCEYEFKGIRIWLSRST